MCRTRHLAILSIAMLRGQRQAAFVDGPLARQRSRHVRVDVPISITRLYQAQDSMMTPPMQRLPATNDSALISQEARVVCNARARCCTGKGRGG